MGLRPSCGFATGTWKVRPIAAPLRIAAAAVLAGADWDSSGRVWAGLLAAVAAGVPTGIRLTGALRLAAST